MSIQLTMDPGCPGTQDVAVGAYNLAMLPGKHDVLTSILPPVETTATTTSTHHGCMHVCQVEHHVATQQCLLL